MECKGVRAANIGYISCKDIRPLIDLPGFLELQVDKYRRRIINANLVMEIEEKCEWPTKQFPVESKREG